MSAQDDFKATAVPVAAATLMSMLGVGMMVPALPQLAAQAGASGVAAGALIGAYGLSRLLFNTPSGVVVDRFGIARSADVGLLLLVAISLFGYFASGFASLFLAMAMQGAASSVFSTAAMTALVLKAGPQGRGRGMAWFQTSLLLGFALGPVVGGQLVDRFNAHAPYLAQAGIMLLAMASMRAAPRSALVARGPGGPTVGLATLVSPALVIGGLGGFAAFFCRFGIAWNLVPVAAVRDFHLTNSELGWIVGAGTVANVLATPFLGRLVDGWGARPTFLTAGCLNITGLLLLFLAPSHAMLWIVTAIVLLATGIMIPAAGAMALTGASPPVMGRTMGLYRTIGESGMALGPVVVPAITAAAGLPTVGGLLPCAAITVIALTAAALLRPRKLTPGAASRQPTTRDETHPTAR